MIVKANSATLFNSNTSSCGFVIDVENNVVYFRRDSKVPILNLLNDINQLTLDMVKFFEADKESSLEELNALYKQSLPTDSTAI